ncbi:MAG: LacI family transcriptional regulator [Anaerolineae bacterium]|nr:LacI family transcriptional regulator [Anaerolineae bacterium]
MQVTLRQVAEEAGVSIKTVSRVVNGQGEISEATRQRVQSAIEKLGYRPNRLARSLITGKTHTVGAIIPSVTGSFYAEFILAAEKVARERHYNVFLCNSFDDPDLEMNYINLLSERQTDGLLLAGSRLERDALEKITDRHNMAILTPYAIPDALVFSLDDYTLARAAAEHLLSLGHRRIGYMDASWPRGARPRYEGLVSALREAGQPTQDIIVAELYPPDREKLREAARTAALKLFEKGIDFTALVCYADDLALGVLQACVEVGVEVPKDLSLIGFDDVPESRQSQPPLTTVHFDCYALGTAMMTKLLDLIEDDLQAQGPEVFPGSLVIRESTAAPRKGRWLQARDSR